MPLLLTLCFTIDLFFSGSFWIWLISAYERTWKNFWDMSMGLFETSVSKTGCSWFVIGIPHLETHQIPNVFQMSLNSRGSCRLRSHWAALDAQILRLPWRAIFYLKDRLSQARWRTKSLPQWLPLGLVGRHLRKDMEKCEGQQFSRRLSRYQQVEVHFTPLFMWHLYYPLPMCTVHLDIWIYIYIIISISYIGVIYHKSLSTFYILYRHTSLHAYYMLFIMHFFPMRLCIYTCIHILFVYACQILLLKMARRAWQLLGWCSPLCC